MASFVLCFLMFQFVSGNENYRSDAILHHINNGMKFAKEFLGSESIALKVADFVVRAFQPAPVKKQPAGFPDKSTHNNEDSEQNNSNNLYGVPPVISPLPHLVRLLGLQPKQISAVAINALIFVAQMITSFLSGPRIPNRQYRTEDLTTWIQNKNSRRLQELLTAAKNESLPVHIEELIQKQESEEETSCIQLLVCKITPFVNKMQKAVFSEESVSLNKEHHGASFMYKHLPNSEEINSRSNICEHKYKDCNLYE